MSMIGKYIRIKKEQLEETLKNPGLVSDLLYEHDDNKNSLEIDKAWHGIHFLLTSDPWRGTTPLRYVVLGGQPLGHEDIGYGLPQYITPDQVKKAYQDLAQLSPDEIRRRYNAKEFSKAEIYPSIWDEDGVELEYLMSYLDKIIKFFQSAVSKDEAIIFWII